MNALRKMFLVVLAGILVGGYSGVVGQAAAGGTGTGTNQPAGTQNSDGQIKLEDILLNDFESAEDWRAHSTSPLGDTKIKKVVQVGAIEDVYNPAEKTDDEKARFVEGQNNVLGVKGYFVDRGFDRVEVKPPHEYVIRGTGRQLSVWILGRKFKHTAYVTLRDYRGNIHKLRLGRLDFFGWRKLTVTVPGWLPQSIRYAMFDKNLHFVSVYVESDIHEVPGDFYFYIDDLRMKVDKSEAEYPGSQIKDTW